MAGRPPKPTALKLLTGNPGKRKLNKREPKVPKGIPAMPTYLTDRAKAAWKSIGPELERMGVLTLADGKALELLCDAYAEYREAREIVIKLGLTYETQNEAGMVMIRARPEVSIASDAWRRVKLMLNEFGLTPASRTKVATTQGKQPESPWAEVLNG